MTGKTHLAVGVATSLWALQPSSTEAISMTIIAGAAGAALPDIDVKKSRSKIDNLIPWPVAVAIAAALVAADVYFDFGVTRRIIENPKSQTTGAVIFLVYIVVGFYSAHRSITHSAAGLAISTAAVYLIAPTMVPAFAAGYSSHILIDLLNREPVRLAYPAKGGMCLKICKSDGAASDFMAVAAMAGTVWYLVTRGGLYGIS